MNSYTVFCRQEDGQGTTWISDVEANSLEEAKIEGLAQCSADWDWDVADIVVLGVAEGVVNILEWEDGYL